jgi:hypothetical protein
MIRSLSFTTLVLSGVMTATGAAYAMPIAPVSNAAPAIVQAAWGCGPGWHPNPWGRCVPNGPYFGGGWGWGWHRPWYGWHGYGWGWHRWHRW